MVVTRRRGSIILHGPSGSGKTTLAKIYAQAVMCEAPLENGSPCSRCDACDLYEASRQPHFHEINSALDGSTQEVRNLVEGDLLIKPFHADAHVIYFDEAHTLTNKAQQALLKPLEQTSEHIVYIFSLIEPEALIAPLRARCDQFSLGRPTPDEARRYLEQICQSEGLSCEPAAFDLFVRYAPSFRQLAQALEQVATAAQGRPITVDGARTELRRDTVGHVLDYFQALVAGDLDQQRASLAAAQLSPAELANRILDLLLHLKLTQVGPSRVQRQNSDIGLLVDDGDCRALVAGLAARAEVLGIELATLMDEVLEFWSYMPLRIDETVLEAQVVRFHDLMTMDRPVQRDRSEIAARIVRASEGTAYRSNAGRRKPPAWRTGDASSRADQGTHLNARQAEEIYTAATFLAQRYGVTFNARLTLNHAALGISDEKQAVALTSDLGKELGQRFDVWLKDDPGGPDKALLHRVVLHERLSDGTLASTILLHLDGAVEAKARDWIFRKFLAGRQLGGNGWQDDWLEVSHAKSAKGALAHQWQLVRRLWRGLDPSIEVDGVPLIDRLDVPNAWRQPAGDVSQRRFSVSQSLSQASRQEMATDLPSFRSLFAERRWDQLFSGWELKAFEARQTALHRLRMIQGDLQRERAVATDSLAMRQLAFEEEQVQIEVKIMLKNQIYNII